MILSMTGFAATDTDVASGRIRIEIRSVNHRYLDLNIRLSHRLHAFEQKIRNEIKKYVSRGKVDVSIRYDMSHDADETVVVNKALAGQYLDAFREIAEAYNLPDNITASKVAFCNDVLTLQETRIDADALWESVNDALHMTVDAFIVSRKEEGARLYEDLSDKIKDVQALVEKIEARSPQIIEEYKKKLHERVEELLDNKDIDEGRLAMEVVLLADKICVDEEIVRLKSHVKAAQDTLDKESEVGRKLDFIAQEMNREANTILSKTNDAALSEIGIELKTLIEKIREQIQNLE